MLKRKIYDDLMNWKAHGDKPLLVYGQRQVGKTFIIEKFGMENFKNYVYIDLNKDTEFVDMFNKGGWDVNKIMMTIGIIFDLKDLNPDNTLLFLDEIQECPAARSALKTFALDGRFKVIASGSMLGVSNRVNEKNNHFLIPMGYEQQMVMYGLDFEEFLWANGIPDEVIKIVKDSIVGCEALETIFLHKFEELFRLFQIVGGMPASVQAFVDNKNSFNKSHDVQNIIISQCYNDVNKYNSGINAVKTAECLKSIPSQLSETNKKFQYSRISNNSNSRCNAEKYMENLLWIKDGGYGNFCYGLKQITRPILGQVKRDVFKIYLSDTGLLTCMYGNDAVKAIFNSESSFNSGAITENVVAECLMKSKIQPLYYQNNNGEGRMEIDFILNFVGGPVAVEVKSGKSRNSPSLAKISNYWTVQRKIKLEKCNIFKDGEGVEHYPLFAAAFLYLLEEKPDYLK